jgi:predicted dehydrogenase
MRRLRTLIVGFGKIGAGYADDPVMAKHFEFATHAQVLSLHPAFVWDACVDPSSDALKQARERWGMQIAVPRIEDLPDGYAPDVVVIATPPSTRALIVEAFPHAKAFLVEKPMGLDAAEGEALVRHCAQRGVLLQVMLWRRADSGLRALSEGGLARLVGDVQTITCAYGNGLRNNGVHMIDLVRMLAGEVASVRALAPWSESCGPLPGDTDIPFHLTLANGVPVSFLPLDFRYYRENSIEIWGREGRLSIRQEGLTAKLHRRVANRAMHSEYEIDGDVAEAVFTAPGRAFYDLYNNLANAIADQTALWSSGTSALRSESVVDAVWQSMQAGSELMSLQQP